jgi:hypothetical protein
MRSVVYRRPTYLQGRGLEITSHAIEYLVDSSLHDSLAMGPDVEALQILKKANLDIFSECRETTSIRQMFRNQSRLIFSLFT